MEKGYILLSFIINFTMSVLGVWNWGLISLIAKAIQERFETNNNIL